MEAASSSAHPTGKRSRTSIASMTSEDIPTGRRNGAVEREKPGAKNKGTAIQTAPFSHSTTTPSSGRRANSHGLRAPATCIVPPGPSANHPDGQQHAHRADSHRLRACASTPVPHTRSPLKRSLQKRPASLQLPPHLAETYARPCLSPLPHVKSNNDEARAPSGRLSRALSL
jgi:hypothetical protein